MKSFFTIAAMLLFTVCAMAQYTVTGKVIDADDGQPVVGCAVMESGTTNGTVTDIDGNFSLKVGANSAIVELSYLGYKSVSLNTSSANAKLGTIKLEGDWEMLDDVVVTSSVAVARKTPVALSSISPEIIEEKLGTQEFPEI